jgi:hypothetical protein
MSANLDIIVAPNAVALTDLKKAESDETAATTQESSSPFGNQALQNVLRIVREQVKENMNLVATIIAVILGKIEKEI